MAAIHIFIDSNIYLKFYAYTDDTLGELEKLLALSETQDVKIYLTEQVKDEVTRNRESKIAEALSQFQKSANAAQIPRFAMHFEKATELSEHCKKVAQSKSALIEQIDSQVRDVTLKADELIGLLYQSAENIPISEELLEAAKIRRARGNPPGKSDSLSDQINWAALIKTVPATADLHIITGDNDFSSKLDPSVPMKFIELEWAEKNGGALFTYRSISQFAKEHFPQINLPIDALKNDAITKLSNSSNFDQTHNQIAILSDMLDEINFEDATILFNALINNEQINWIAGDPDVKDFYVDLYRKFITATSQEMDEKLVETASYLSDVPPF